MLNSLVGDIEYHRFMHIHRYILNEEKKQVIKNLFRYRLQASSVLFFKWKSREFYCNLMRLLFRVTRAILKYTAHSHMDLSYCSSTIDQTINALIQLPQRLRDYLNARQKQASKKSNQISNSAPSQRLVLKSHLKL